LRKTYRRNNFKELSRQIIIIGFILVISVILGTYLNKMWPSYQNKIVDNINPFIEYYNNSSINLKSTIITNLKSDTSFMFKIIILSLVH
jgi:stage II sporulation protein M